MRSYSQRRAAAVISLAAIVAAAALMVLFVYNATPAPLPLGERMPLFHTITIGGEAFVQDTLDGKRSLLVFFNPGCSHCRRELENLDELQPRYADKLDIIGMSLDSLGATQTMTAELKLKFPVVVADDQQLKKTPKINILPALFFVDKFQILRKYYAGEHSLAVDKRLIEDFIFPANTP